MAEDDLFNVLNGSLLKDFVFLEHFWRNALWVCVWKVLWLSIELLLILVFLVSLIGFFVNCSVNSDMSLTLDSREVLSFKLMTQLPLTGQLFYR